MRLLLTSLAPERALLHRRRAEGTRSSCWMHTTAGKGTLEEWMHLSKRDAELKAEELVGGWIGRVDPTHEIGRAHV